MELITPKQVRKILGVSNNKLKTFVASGLLTRYALKNSQGYKYDRNEVEALIICPPVSDRANAQKLEARPGAKGGLRGAGARRQKTSFSAPGYDQFPGRILSAGL
jgi:hypothetical protein